MPFSSGQHFTVASKLYCDLCRYIAEDAPVEDPRSKRHSGIQLCCECNTRLSVCLIEEKPYCGPCRAVVLSKKPKAAATNVVEQATNLEGTCEGCHKQLSGVCLEGLGKSWHERCFICVACKQPFIFSRAFVAVDNKPFCPECNQRREAGESAQIGSHNSTVPPPLITADSKKKLLGFCPVDSALFIMIILRIICSCWLQIPESALAAAIIWLEDRQHARHARSKIRLPHRCVHVCLLARGFSRLYLDHPIKKPVVKNVQIASPMALRSLWQEKHTTLSVSAATCAQSRFNSVTTPPSTALIFATLVPCWQGSKTAKKKLLRSLLQPQLQGHPPLPSHHKPQHR
eukprot:TRINITY_DN5497_c0_g1_i4.p1 TRINITY_DN5497_c0_g1~~TRINITY_DN5497_c0_g1_i4.p1  ORF type:complete len:382 (+),score=37.37 TRINITY_DN5497_c0_g1_i4:116-1147(+)